MRAEPHIGQPGLAVTAPSSFTGVTSTAAGPRIVGLSSPQMLASGRVKFPWDKPGDALTFELTVKVPGGDDSKIKAELWANANHNDGVEREQPSPQSIRELLSNPYFSNHSGALGSSAIN